jgi:beta-lactamase class A
MENKKIIKTIVNRYLVKVRNKKIPLPLSLLFLILFGVITHFTTKTVVTREIEEMNARENYSAYSFRRMKGFKLIRPLMVVKPVQESNLYSGLKLDINNIIAAYKENGTLSSGAVYFRDFIHSDWISINDIEKYDPGSILKIPMMMCYLLMEEEKPGTFDKKLLFEKKYDVPFKPFYIERGIEYGRSYSIKELLNYIIVDSDNNANFLLNANMDLNKFLKIFNDLSILIPDIRAASLPINVRECSRFIEVLVNSTYLNESKSEYALSLLAKSKFKEGIIKGINENDVVVAHKFGEAGDDINHQLHETAVFYVNNQPYLLTIMTRGNKNVSFDKLAEVIQKISGAIYVNLNKSK